MDDPAAMAHIPATLMVFDMETEKEQSTVYSTLAQSVSSRALATTTCGFKRPENVCRGRDILVQLGNLRLGHIYGIAQRVPRIDGCLLLDGLRGVGRCIGGVCLLEVVEERGCRGRCKRRRTRGGPIQTRCRNNQVPPPFV
jgi:hypothetical protein